MEANGKIGGKITYTPPEATGGIGGEVGGEIGGSSGGGASVGTTEEATARDKTTASIAESREYSAGCETSGNDGLYWDISNSSTSTWNSTNGYENSYETSRNTEISNTVSAVIYDRYSYTSINDRGGSNSSTQSTGESQELTDEYTSTIEYSVEEQTTLRKSITYTSNATGYYRIVNAGTVHVFAVVGYDIATNSYYTYTYNVLDKDTYEYLDYSKDNANFNDCENAILPFEIPYEVHKIVSKVIARSEKLAIDIDTGYITDYNGDSQWVVIPEYVSVNNGDGTYSAIRVRGIEDGAFKGNTNIKAVSLPKYVYKIPDNAFEGCTSLETVFGYGISEIGANAFKNCTSLNKFSIDKYIASLGDNAFENVPEISVEAVNTNVVASTISSEAKKITLNISSLAFEESIDNTKISIPATTEYFAFISNGSSYNNLQIESDATETYISNVIFKNNVDTPLKLGSNVITLGRVTIENAPGFALVMSSENTALNLYGTITLSSSGENAVISKNVKLALVKDEVSSKLKLTGNHLVCGELTNSKMLSFVSGELINITEEQFNSYLTSTIITFDPNGGAVADTTKTVYYGQLYGELPVPTRDNYTFDGWYTEKDAGTKITADTSVTALVNQTLYARWAPNKFMLTYNANGGTVSPDSKELTFGDSYGTLPTPKRDYYTFTGWYTAASGGTQVSANTTPTDADDVTIYAQWQQKPVLGWVKASKVPAGAQIVERKWAYTLREYTSNAASSLSGWTKYETKRTGWSSWSNWATWNPDNGVRNVEWRSVYDHTEYHYYRWTNSSHNAIYTEKTSNCTILEEKWFNYVLPRASGYTNIGYDGTDTWANRWVRADYAGNYDTDKTWSRTVNRDEWRYQDPIYTYYYYRDVNKEATSYPSGSDISNIVEWVMYREK